MMHRFSLVFLYSDSFKALPQKKPNPLFFSFFSLFFFFLSFLPQEVFFWSVICVALIFVRVRRNGFGRLLFSMLVIDSFVTHSLTHINTRNTNSQLAIVSRTQGMHAKFKFVVDFSLPNQNNNKKRKETRNAKMN